MLSFLQAEVVGDGAARPRKYCVILYDMINYQASVVNCGYSSAGRALASQAKGREFESRCPLQK